MVDQEKITEIFKKITVTSEHPVPIGGRCESKTFYQVTDLDEADLDTAAQYIAERLHKVISPSKPDLFLRLPGGHTELATRLAKIYSELYLPSRNIQVETYQSTTISNGLGDKFRGKSSVLVTDVITTARSTLEAHAKATLRGIKVIAWACLIDRTFGPGPVSVVAAFTGAPVTLLSN
ncbi:MAG TPA: phosphoribosyltransferase [Oligoflexia bacterium]|nr:phosphoribosyltransferase [Oligoflexia bacterium]HMP27788.1 phosphoribosyltransferase [Oligoflexia bacterium]